MQRLAAFLLASIACFSVLTSPSARGDERSLLQTIAEWQYPGSALSGAQATDGATVDASGERTAPSVVFKTVMTTDAAVDTVLNYYRTKLAKGNAAGRSVFFSDDSEGRPFALHTIIVNSINVSTTLVISRGKDETKTYIGWKQYRRFDVAASTPAR
jgi:hypothetical protein